MNTRKGVLCVTVFFSVGLVFLLLSLLQGLQPPVSLAKPLQDVFVNTDIATNTTWTVISSPYILQSDIVVTPGVTLTIEPGVVVKGETLTQLRVRGRLIALGTSAQPITFTSNSDSARRQWEGLVFDGGTGRLRYATVRYTGRDNGIALANIVVSGVLTGQVSIENSDVYSGGYGNFDDYGLYIQDSRVVVSGTRFIDTNGNSPSDTDFALYAIGDSTVVTLTNNTFADNEDYAMGVEAGHLHHVTLISNTFSNNGLDRVLVAGGSVTEAVTLRPQNGLEGYELDDDLFVPAGLTLTVEPGTMVMGQSLAELHVMGTLLAPGTPTQPITFTSDADAGPGEWAGLVLAGGTGQLQHVTVRYGGHSTANSLGQRSNVAVSGVLTGQVWIEDSQVLSASIGGSTDCGLYVANSRVLVSGTTFGGNGDSTNNDYALGILGANAVVTLTNNTFRDNNGYAARFEAGHLHHVALISNTLRDNGLDRVLIFGGSVTGTPTLIPQSGLQSYELESDLTVPAGVALTIEPDTMVMARDTSDLLVRGHLQALGSVTQPITFTRDDTGGSRWMGLFFDGGTGQLRHATVSWGGWSANQAGVQSGIAVSGVLAGQVRIENSQVLSVPGRINQPDSGLYVARSHVVVNDTEFRDNGDERGNYALYATDNSVITVTASTFHYNGGSGVGVDGSQALLSCNTVVTNNRNGIHVTGSGISVTMVGTSLYGNAVALNTNDLRNETGVTVTARYNWWGGSSPDVYGPVDTDPTLSAPSCVLDLAVTKSDWPDPVFVESPLTYTITLVNNSPASASDLVLTDSLPLNVTFGAALPSQGDCNGTNETVTCTLGALAGSVYTDHAPASVTIVVTPSVAAEGLRVNTATVASQELDPWTANSTATITTTVNPLADLAVVKRDFPDPVGLGELLTYTAIVTNTGPSTALGVVLTDTLPGSVNVFSASSPQGTCGTANPVTCTLPPLGRNATATVSIVVAPTQVGLMTNTVQVKGAQSDPQLSNNVFTETTTVSTADLWVTKSDAPDPLKVGDRLTYTVVITNSGPNDALAVLLTDTLPLSVTNVLTAAGQGSCSLAGNLVVCDLGVVSDQATTAVTLTVVPSQAGSLHNEVRVDTAGFDPNLGNNTDATDTSVDPVADLAVTKSAWPEPVGLGEPLTYTLVVTNAGPSTTTGIVLTDTLPLSVTSVLMASSQGSCALENAAVVCDLGALGHQARAFITLTVRPTATGILTNRVVVTSVAFDPGLGDNAFSQGSTVVPAADLGVTKKDAPDPLMVGETLTYTITVVNYGPSTATGVVLTDTLPAGVDLGDYSPVCSGTGPVTCTWGSLAQGAVETVTIVVTPTLTGTFTNSVEVAGLELDPRTGDNESQARTTTGVADLQVVKTLASSVEPTLTPSPVLVGYPLTYTILVTNAGPDTATEVWLTDTLPASVNLGAITPGAGACVEVDARTVTCDLGALADGASTAVAIVVTPTLAGSITNTARVTGAQVDPTPADDVATAHTVVDPVADLAVSKTSASSVEPALVGEPLTYTIVVTNAGPSAASGVVLTDTLPPELALLAASAGCSGVGPVYCALGTLNAGMTTTVTITVEPTVSGFFTNVVDVMSLAFDPDTNDNTATVGTAVESGVEKIYLPLVLRNH